jgi:hypothetical protein
MLKHLTFKRDTNSRGFNSNMKKPSLINSSVMLPSIWMLTGLAACLVLAQSASAQYNAVDISSTITAGPVINAKSITSSPPKPVGNLKTEAGVHQFRELLPPMKKTGAALEQIQAAMPLAAVSEAATQPSFRGFTGLTHLDQRFANGGNQFSHEPPDQGLAVGNNFVMEAVNCAINIYDVNGVVQLPRPLALTEIFGLPEELNRTTGVINTSVGDPSCLFDPETQRWFVMAWAQLNRPTGQPLRQSRLYLAVSQTSDPTGDYKTYVFNTTGTADVDQAGPRVPDFPHFAVDRYGLYINWQEFAIDENGNLDGFIGTAIVAVSKNALINGAGGTAPHRAQRFALPFQTGFEFRIWPAYIPPGQTPVLANGGTEYFLSSNLGFDSFNQIAVWALTNTSSLATANPDLQLNMTVVNTLTYHFPEFSVPQKDGFHPLGASQGFPVADLDAGPDSISSCEYVNGHIWGTLSSAMKDSSGKTIEVVDYFAFTPQIKNGTLTASRFTQGVIAAPGRFLMYPAIALNKNNNGAIGFSLSSKNDFPSAAFVSISGTSRSAIHISREGNEPEDGFTCYPPFSNGVCRWGDYSAGAVNNIDRTIWTATEYVPDINRSSQANWATYVTRFQP